MITTIVTTVIVTLIAVALIVILYRPITTFFCVMWMAWCMGAFARLFQVAALALGLFLGFYGVLIMRKRPFQN